jgi:GTP:adenosylcobinamide-phosphate guanylyltransferase
MEVPAVVAAGDRGAAKAIHGESKAFLELEGRALVAHVVATLQRVPEVSEVWVVGDGARLEAALRPELDAELTKPLHILPQFDDLLANLWESYRRLLPGAGPEGRDPASPEDEQLSVLYLSGDLPFATPQEVSSFVQRARALPCDYALGLCSEEPMELFHADSPVAPGIHMASFNLREDRYRQNNLHLVRPALLANRSSIEDMYRNRHQKELSQILKLAWGLLRREGGGLAVIWYFALMHVAGLADRRGRRGIANAIRRWIPIARVERGCSALLGTRFRFCVTDVGGCALDLDTEEDFDIAKLRFREWRESQEQRAEALHGPLPLPADGGQRTGSS